MEEINLQSSSSDETLSRKHAAMMERLSTRHNSRLSSSTKPEESDPTSNTQSFLSQFNQSKSSIQSQISTLTPPNPNPKPQLHDISLQISSLEKLIAQNSYFLPSYEIRTCLSTVATLKQSLDDVTLLLIPKKKFSFSKKSASNNKTSTKIVEPEKEANNNVSSAFNDLKDAPGFRKLENELLVKDFNTSSECGEDRIGEFTLSHLKNCEVRLKGCVRALFVNNLVNCKVYVGAITGSVLIEGAEGCVFVVASHQIRIHDAKGCDFYLRSRSRPIIEDCSGVRFAPYCLVYQGLDKDLTEANLCEDNGNWMNVDDFKWLRAVQSPNWEVLPENERIATVNID